jgi:hypothetical protein
MAASSIITSYTLGALFLSIFGQNKKH